MDEIVAITDFYLGVQYAKCAKSFYRKDRPLCLNSQREWLVHRHERVFEDQGYGLIR